MLAMFVFAVLVVAGLGAGGRAAAETRWSAPAGW